MNQGTLTKAGTIFLCLLLPNLSTCNAKAAAPDRMTYAQAKARIPGRQMPDFWIGDVKDLPHDEPFKVSLESGKNPSSFNLTSALYHVSGAGSFTFECPHGICGACQVTPEQILDIQLTLYEAMLQHEINKKS